MINLTVMSGVSILIHSHSSEVVDRSSRGAASVPKLTGSHRQLEAQALVRQPGRANRPPSPGHQACNQKQH